MPKSFFSRPLSQLLALCGLCGAAAVSRAQNVVINEIMYHPPGTNVLEQWIELSNRGPTEVNLGGWRLMKAVDFAFPSGLRLAAGGFLAVAANSEAFTNRYPGVVNFVAGWEGTLDYDGEEIQLQDAKGTIIDQVSYSSEGDWAVRRLSVPDRFKKQGWEWFAAHNGEGSSAELIEANLPNDNGQNWGASVEAGGTPGRANSLARDNVAPILVGPTHFPLVPRPGESVTVRARLVDEDPSALTVTLFWRLDGAAEFAAAPMLDDGQHGDGFGGDRLFACLLPGHAAKTIVEYYLVARDSQGNERRFPNVVPSGTDRTANLVYQVDEEVFVGPQPLIRLILTRAEMDYLSNEIWNGSPTSDALVNGTFINLDQILEDGSTSQCRDQCGIRNRGNGTRSNVPHNIHVAFPKDQPWKGRAGLNLNTSYVASQHLGSAVFRSLGLPVAESRPVQVRVNGINLAKPGQEQFGCYAANDLVNGALVQRQFPLDHAGQLYRGIRDRSGGTNLFVADLLWHGPDYTIYTNVYAKENRGSLNDWSDLIQLLDTLNHTPDADYAQAVERIVNVEEWMRYFAINTLIANQENGLSNGSGDDFSLYRGGRDRRFLLLPYDLDSLLGRGTRTESYRDGIWRMANLPVVNRFIRHPDFVPLYFKQLTELAGTALSPDRLNPLIDHLLSGYVDGATIANMKAFHSNQVAYVLSQFPHGLTVGSELVVSNGYPRTGIATVALSGTGDPVQTRGILVNGSPAAWVAWRGTWTNLVTLAPGINRVLVQAIDLTGAEIDRAYYDIWHDDGHTQLAPATISADASWKAADGPYQVASDLSIAPGASLTIEPGTSVYFGAGVNLTVSDGARLLAEGTDTAPILFTGPPGGAQHWGHVVIRGGAGSPETRLAYMHFADNESSSSTPCLQVTGGTVFLDHLTFGNPAAPYLHLDGASFVVQDCHFPSPTAEFEPVHGTEGIKAGGRGLFRRNFFGAPRGYNDAVDFTGGRRAAGSIVQFINNVFAGTGDDELDLDGTDAWVQGNLFLHAHQNGSPDTSSAISGGNNNGDASAITIIGNFFYDCDHAVTAKQGNFYALFHNTIVHQTHQGGLDVDGAVLNLADVGTTEGAGVYLEGNLIDDAEKLVRNWTTATITLSNNLITLPWTGAGGGNFTGDPLFRSRPTVAETYFTNWQTAQVLRQWFSLQPGSPALGGDRDGPQTGAGNPLGALISGGPDATTADTHAEWLVGPHHTGNGISPVAFPNGSGFTSYRWRLDQSDWSAVTPISSPVRLADLGPGPHQLAIVGQNDAGLFQDDAVLGSDQSTTVSRTWVVDPNQITSTRVTVRINEVILGNATPELIELYNDGAQPVDLTGIGLSDSAAAPRRFTFPSGTVLPAGAMVVLSADASSGPPYLHTGFQLNPTGADLYLTDSAARGSALLDVVQFGRQIAGYSIGRRADGTWGLCDPTPGRENIAQVTGARASLRINEWLADARFSGLDDFVELYNPEPLPVDLGRLFLSDAPGSLDRHAIAPLSFIAAQGFAEFVADGSPANGRNHLSFKLAPETGSITLSAADRTIIDSITYDTQRTDVSEGRSPNGSDSFAVSTQPTPASGNPGAKAPAPSTETLRVPLHPMDGPWRYNQQQNLDGLAWTAPSYDDSAWPVGRGLLGVEDCNCLPAPDLQTRLSLGRITYYFRTAFVVDTNLAGFDLNLNMVVDDGAIIHLNGAPILTNGVNRAAPAYATEASRNVSNARAESFVLRDIPVLTGTNILAVEVHQTASDSSDIVWGLALEATRTVTNLPPPALRPVVLNELRATPSAGPSGNEGAYIELFNGSTNQATLAEMSLSDDARFPRKWVFPPDASIPPGGYRVVYCDHRQPISSTNTGLTLPLNGAVVLLFDSPAAGGSLLDGIRYGLQPPRFSIGRVPDGTGAWALIRSSPGGTNDAVNLANADGLRINEWMADPVDGSDWFELYNSSSEPVALAGLSLTDDPSRPTDSPLPPLSFIGVGTNAFIQFMADGDAQAGADHVSFSLKKSGESVALFASGGALLDGVAFANQAAGISQGRLPDGASNVVAFVASASPGASNYLSDSDGDGLDDRWEMTYFGSLSHDGRADSDGDGLTDREEFVAGTNPADAGNALRVVSVGWIDGLALQFDAVAGISYTVQYRDAIGSEGWQKLQDVAPRSASGVVTITDLRPLGEERFYRIVIPSQP
ncbi:MAG: lamin tail domain-containing protein [Verrucomicrobiota bacterium]